MLPMVYGYIAYPRGKPDTLSDKARGFALLSAPYGVVGHAGAKALRPLPRLHLWGPPTVFEPRAKYNSRAKILCQLTISS